MKAKSSRYLITICVVLITLSLGALWPMLLRAATGAAPESGVDKSVSEAEPVDEVAPRQPESLLFVENVGQFDPQVRFMVRQGARQLWLTEQGLWISDLDQAALAEAQERWQETGDRAVAIPGAHLRVRFAGANDRPLIEPFGPLSARFSYFLGNDPAAWRANAPVWSGVRYYDLYPGIDLVIAADSAVSGAAAAVPWRLEARAGANLNAISLQVDGPDSLVIDDGHIQMTTSAGKIMIPLLTATTGGDDPSAEELLSVTAPSVTTGEPGRFIVSAPLARRETAGQPAEPADLADLADLAYSTYLGGSGNADFGEDVAVDGAGAVYVAGHAQSTDFPTTPGAYTTTLQARDAFVSKFDPAGNGAADLIYSTFIGGASLDDGLSVAVVNGQAHLVGETASSSFPTTPGAFRESCGTDGLCDSFNDAFLTVLSAGGDSLLYSTFLGGQRQDRANAIAISGGELYIAGDTRSRDFPTSNGAFDRECGSDGRCDPIGNDPGQDGFFVKMVAAGNGQNDLLYGTFLGGWGLDQANDIAATGGQGLIIGDTDSPDFPVSPGGGTYSGARDAFVMRLTTTGSGSSDRVFGLFLGGTAAETGAGIDAIGGTSVAVGLTRSSNFPITAGTEPFQGGFSDAYVAWLDGAGAVTYAAYLGGSSLDTAEAVALDGRGGAVLTGYTFSADFPTEGAYDDTFNGGYDLFVSRMDLNSTRRADFLTYSSFLGGSDDDEGYALDLDADGYAHLTGQTWSTDYPTTTGAFKTTISGTIDIFFSKLLAAPPPGIDIEKSTNDFDADEPPGPYVTVGSPITWRYVITNTGGFTLTNVQVADDQLGVVCSLASLAPQETHTCIETGSATPDQYFNTATVTADPPPELGLDPVIDIDLSHYFGALPLINLEKYTNDRNADGPPGPFIRVGDPVTWTYVVTNTGNVPLSGIVVTDSVEGPALCGFTSLERNQQATCIITATNGSTAGQYSNTGYATGTPPGGLADVTDQDDSHYYGADPSVAMLKLTNGQFARNLPGPYVLINDPVTWTYVITNTGNVTVSITSVIDDQDVAVNCPNPEISVDGWTACMGSDLAVAGQYTNSAVVMAAVSVGDAGPTGRAADVSNTNSVGAVTVSDPNAGNAVTAGDAGAIGDPVSAFDSSHYFGVDPGVSLKKLTNGQDAKAPPGPFIREGDPVNWTYIVTNTGNITLTTVSVTDSKGVSVSCDPAPIGPGQAKSCTASGAAASGQYSNTGSVLATPLFGPDVTAADLSHYYGSSPAISVVKRTNGVTAAAAPGPYIKTGDPVTWTYEVANDGNVTLTGIAVGDNKLGPISCPADTLDPGQTTTCQATGASAAGQYSNTVVATGTPPVGEDVTGTDISFYFGVDADIGLKKLTNGQDASQPPGPYITAGEPVNWTFVVSNTGNSRLTEIDLSDDQLGGVTCPQTTLSSGQQMLCEVSGVATAGQHANTATVTAKPPAGPNVTAKDNSHYYGVEPEVAIKKLTNGRLAPVAPGPFIPEGDPVAWTYIVTNTGNITLTTVTVTDDRGVTVDCPASSLGLDKAMVCTGAGVAGSGQYSNTALATATPLAGPQVFASDISHYYGSSPAISLVKRTNGQIARSAPGPYILTGDAVNWAYEVTNSGNITLSAINLVDDPLGQITCPEDALGAGESMTCVTSGVAITGQYSNTAVISGTPPVGEVVTAGDISHYFGADPEVILQKLTNGQDAGVPPGPLVPEGETVSWTYIVTNTGNITLTSMTVTDSRGESVNCDASPLGPGQDKICTASAPAVSGQYSNTGSVLATPLFGPDVTWSDVSHYYGSSPAIAVVKRTNGAIARVPPGPGVTVGGSVTWLYEVSNSGNITLTNIAVTDNKLGAITCPRTALGMGEAMTCQRNGLATAGQYSNTVSVVGTPPVGQDVTGDDLSHYFGVDAAIGLKKLTNGQEGNDPPGPYVLVDDPVSWTFVVSNTGNSDLTEIGLTDDQLGTVTCPLTALAVGQQMQCEVSGTAAAGQHANIATVEGKPPIGPTVTAQDTSHYFGVQAGVAIKKRTNGQDAGSAPGPFIMEGDPVSWTYIVTNTGNITLTTVTVTDDQGVTVDCAASSLGLDETMTCTGTGLAASGQYSNIGSATATPLFGPDVMDSDPSHYFGVSPALTMVKRTNGQIARNAPGPYVLVTDPVTWTYVVTNSGNITLSAISLIDDQLGAVACPMSILSAGESMTCEIGGLATAGQYTNTASVTGTPTADSPAAPTRRASTTLARPRDLSRPLSETTCPFNLPGSGYATSCAIEEPAPGHDLAEAWPATGPPVGDVISATDTSHYFGADPQIAIQKYTNGLPAGEPPGPIVDFQAGEIVTWTIVVSNTGNVPLEAVTVVDDNGTPGDPQDDFSCDFGAMPVAGPAQSCTFLAAAVSGQYRNVALVTATPPGDLKQITSEAISHYFGADPAVALTKLTNGYDVAAPPGPGLIINRPVVWTYVVRNSGNITLTQLTVLDQEGITLDPASADKVCEIESLGPGLTAECSLEGIVVPGQYTNTATVSGLPLVGDTVFAEDRSYYFGSAGVFLPLLIKG